MFMVFQVAFRAKVGKRYQLPHKGIIPEEFGVVIFILNRETIILTCSTLIFLFLLSTLNSLVASCFLSRLLDTKDKGGQLSQVFATLDGSMANLLFLMERFRVLCSIFVITQLTPVIYLGDVVPSVTWLLSLIYVLLQYIKGGPVVGFVYWAPEFHFLVFFNRLRLQEQISFYLN